MMAVIGSAGSSDTSVTDLMAVPVSRAVRCRLMFSTMAAPSNGVPSWNVTPSRAVIFQTVKSSLGSIAEARYGWGTLSLPGMASESYTERMIWWHEMAQIISEGRHGDEVSASTAMTRLPPATGVTAGSVAGVVSAGVVSAGVVSPGAAETGVVAATGVLSAVFLSLEQAAAMSAKLITVAPSTTPLRRRMDRFVVRMDFPLGVDDPVKPDGTVTPATAIGTLVTSAVLRTTSRPTRRRFTGS